MAAHAQGKFWEMHDILFANQRFLDKPKLFEYAKKIGLDMDPFKKAMLDHQFGPEVERTMEEGQYAGVRGTPTMFVNGRLATGADSFDSLRPMLDVELEKGKALVARGEKDPYAHLTRDGKIMKPFADQKVELDTADAPARGPETAEVELVLFSDFQCPYCKRFEEPVQQLLERYAGKARLVMKQFPLPFHKQAHLAAEAALAAHAQGKYWQMQELLFKNNKQLEREALLRYAKEIALDTERFARELDDGTYRAAVDKEMQEGRKAGVNGTPTLFVNGRLYEGAGASAALLARDIDKHVLAQ
jgi:protein-disulfide isomerase